MTRGHVEPDRSLPAIAVRFQPGILSLGSKRRHPGKEDPMAETRMTSMVEKIAALQDFALYRDLAWEGTFEDYLQIGRRAVDPVEHRAPFKLVPASA